MILEHAVLQVPERETAAFEAAFREAASIIASVPGFVDVRLERSLETVGRYLLLVSWERLEDHTESFRGSPGYQQWRRLLHHFYDPFPTVEHFEMVLEAGS